MGLLERSPYKSKIRHSSSRVLCGCSLESRASCFREVVVLVTNQIKSIRGITISLGTKTISHKVRSMPTKIRPRLASIYLEVQFLCSLATFMSGAILYFLLNALSSRGQFKHREGKIEGYISFSIFKNS